MVELNSAPNFRDLGGYRTEAGRRVALRRIYRSGKLSGLILSDQTAVAELKLGCVIDLRAGDERRSEPSRWSAWPADIYESPKASMAPVMREMLAQAADGRGAREAMIDFYRRIPVLLEEEYAALFRRLIKADRPVLIHCTAGKDRTGVASALLLSVLGVAHADIVEDYVLTESRLPARASAHDAAPVGGEGLAEATLASIPPDARRALWRADPAYLEAMFDAVARTHGSATDYLTQALGVGTDEVVQMRDNLTEAP